MKNLLKILLVLAFATPVFASSNMQMPNPASVTTDDIKGMKPADVNGWLESLTMDQYKMLKSEVRQWINSGLTMDQYKMLKPEVQALVTMPASSN